MIRPIMIILASFATGILANGSLGSNYKISAAPLLSIILILFIISFIALIKRPDSARFFIYPCFFLLGALFILPSLTSNFTADHISMFTNTKPGPLGASFSGVLLKTPEVSNGQSKLYVDLKKFYPPGKEPQDITGKIRLKVASRLGSTPPEALSGLLRGDTLRFLATLSSPRNFNNPGSFDYEWWLARKGIFVTGRITNELFLVKTANGSPGLMRSIDGIRRNVNRFIDNFYVDKDSGASGEIIKALTTGERGSIDKTTREAFIKTGTAHILAISGLHIGIVALLAYLVFFNLLRLSERLSLAINIKKLSWALALIPVGFYGALAGLPVSTQRAIIMIATFVLAYLLERGRDPYATLALAALIVLVLHPGSLWDASFQFSFSAVFAIFYLVKRFDNITSSTNNEWGIKKQRGALNFFTYKIKILILVTIAASIGTIPLSIYHFNNLPLFGMPLNLIVVPIVSALIIPLSLLAVVLIPISETLATLLLSLDDLLISTLVRLITAVSKFEFSHIKVSTISIMEIISFYLIIFTLFEIKKRRYLLYVLPILITGLTFPAAFNYYQSTTSKTLRVTFLNVGQGESTFIEFPGGKTMLIDGGASYRGGFNIGEAVIAPFLRSKRIKNIDYLVMSHAQRDHKGGLPFLIRSFNIGEFWWNGKGNITAISEALEARGAPSLIKNSTTKEFDINGVTVRFLNPAPEESAGLSLNEGSLILKLTYRNKSLLFTGDIGLVTETLLKKNLNLNADILKAPHHGSRYSSSADFLDMVAPGFVVISAGFDNSYGFPHKETLERFHDIGARVFRTDRHGAVEAVIEDGTIEFKTYAPTLPDI